MKSNVYIATLARSGSTLLGMMLNNNRNIFHTGESSYWGKLDPSKITCSCGKIACPILMQTYQQAGYLPEVHAIYKACSQIDRFLEPDKISHALSLPNNIAEITSWAEIENNLTAACCGLEILSDLFRQLSGKSIIVDNTKNIHLAERLLERQWKIILLTRDPRGIANSSKNAGMRKNVPRPVISKIPIFLDFAVRAINLLSAPATLFIRYEDLCQNPELSLTRVCEFLNIEYNHSMLNFRADKGHTLMGNHMRFDTGLSILEDKKWHSQLGPEEISLFSQNQTLIDLYKRLGYDLRS